MRQDDVGIKNVRILQQTLKQVIVAKVAEVSSLQILPRYVGKQ